MTTVNFLKGCIVTQQWVHLGTAVDYMCNFHPCSVTTPLLKVIVVLEPIPAASGQLSSEGHTGRLTTLEGIPESPITQRFYVGKYE